MRSVIRPSRPVVGSEAVVAGVDAGGVDAPGGPVGSVVPGLCAAAVAVVLALLVHGIGGAVSPLVVAVALGVVVANTGALGRWVRPGARFAARRLLRIGIVLLGFQLSLGELRSLGTAGVGVVAVTVVVTFIGTRWIGRRLGLSDALSLLIATGTSICGASAIAAVEEVAGADEDEVAFAVALITLCGTLAIAVLPALGHLAGLTDQAFGSWVGSSVHDVGQVVAAATPRGGVAIRAAVVVKLTRVILLAPLVATLTVARRRRLAIEPDRPAAPASRPAMVPLFVVGFLVAIVIRTSGVVPAAGLDAVRGTQMVLLSAALFGLGCGVDVRRLRRIGGRPLLLGLVSWTLVAGISLAATRALPG